MSRTARILVLLVCLGICLSLSANALAYTLAYYFGSPSQPVSFVGGAGGSTCCTAFRLFNEATAMTDANPMAFVDLYYSGTKIGSSTGTYYYIVYQNGPSSTASCLMSSGSQFLVTRAYCDTTT